jgi:hypothetical protein
MSRLRGVLGAGLLLVAVGCSDDDAADTASSVTVTIGADGLDVSDDVPAGAVEVTLQGEIPEFGGVDFSRVADGTSEEDFREGLGVLLDGGPFPDFLLSNAGVVPSAEPGTVLLAEGSYFVWYEGEGSDEEDTGIAVTPFTVTAGKTGELPKGSGTIVATDYRFDVDVTAGESFAFRNDGPTQFHHAVLFNFGDLEATVVEENISAFLEGGEESPPPEAFAGVDFENLDAGGSGVFGPGSGGTFEARLESGNTYAVVCFIQDRAGGPPHAFGHDMFEVFTVG